MKLLNRSAIVVRPREPFLRWATAALAEDPEGAAELRNAVSIYLVPQDPNEEQESAPLEGFFAEIFANELESWCSDSELWPAKRDFASFREWFEVTAESIVHDLAPGRIQTERY